MYGDAKLCWKLKFTTTGASIWLNKSGKGRKFEDCSTLLDSFPSACFWTTPTTSSWDKPAVRRAASAAWMWPSQHDLAASSRASPLPPFTQQPKHSQGRHPKDRHLQEAGVHDFCCVQKKWKRFLVHLVGAVLKQQKTRGMGRFSNIHTYRCLTVTPHRPSVPPLFHLWPECECRCCKSRHEKAPSDRAISLLELFLELIFAAQHAAASDRVPSPPCGPLPPTMSLHAGHSQIVSSESRIIATKIYYCRHRFAFYTSYTQYSLHI